ncbi:hypothetical protein EVG20_g11627 [Dentipellis fragilis]|uniref:Uncharacterized protein n=1 Tax=Dentipellis fragilis TaxID=205917 RepID=A0A4Y9XJJ2_9AGAM|nr:hypothetical protein EVG20_g11627 [Dentipellis fragilis]
MRLKPCRNAMQLAPDLSLLSAHRHTRKRIPTGHSSLEIEIENPSRTSTERDPHVRGNGLYGRDPPARVRSRGEKQASRTHWHWDAFVGAARRGWLVIRLCR